MADEKMVQLDLTPFQAGVLGSALTLTMVVLQGRVFPAGNLISFNPVDFHQITECIHGLLLREDIDTLPNNITEAKKAMKHNVDLIQETAEQLLSFALAAAESSDKNPR
jgi:hypothetical protein